MNQFLFRSQLSNYQLFLRNKIIYLYFIKITPKAAKTPPFGGVFITL